MRKRNMVLNGKACTSQNNNKLKGGVATPGSDVCGNVTHSSRDIVLVGVPLKATSQFL